MTAMLTARELQIGDVVETPGGGPWNCAVVKRVSDTDVTLFRPYGTTAGFSVGDPAQAICYIGLEEYSIPLYSRVGYRLMQRDPQR